MNLKTPKKIKHVGRPPVGGYGTRSGRLDTTIRLPVAVLKWVLRKSNVARFVRDLIMSAYDNERRNRL